jgi:cystathionine beta-lyase family protein involved in aluminum resistance
MFSVLSGDFSSDVIQRVSAAHDSLSDVFRNFEEIALFNQQKVLRAFWHYKLAPRHFTPTTGYGYGDDGRDLLDQIYAHVFQTEDALVRTQIVSGTHAIALAMHGLLEAGDTLVSCTGKPYDTLEPAIGINSSTPGSLIQRQINYEQIELIQTGLDYEGIAKAAKTANVMFLQRSRGYEWRDSLSLKDLQKSCNTIKQANPDCMILIDNCYGEFTNREEPSRFGADIIAGSLIKNPGGGLAPTGGYVAGRHDLVERIAERLTCPGLGREVGSYAQTYAPFFQGLFLAPHTVCQALKGAALFARVFEQLNMKTTPGSDAVRNDIIQAIRFQDEESLVKFIQCIQAVSPVDSYVTPYPWDMPGYQHQVIMAAGAFVEGASIELSADAPIKEPYTAYLQGGLTYEHCVLALMQVLTQLLDQ